MIHYYHSTHLCTYILTLYKIFPNHDFANDPAFFCGVSCCCVLAKACCSCSARLWSSIISCMASLKLRRSTSSSYAQPRDGNSGRKKKDQNNIAVVVSSYSRYRYRNKQYNCKTYTFKRHTHATIVISHTMKT